MNTVKLDELLANLELAISELRSFITDRSDPTPDLISDSTKIKSALSEARVSDNDKNKAEELTDKTIDNQTDDSSNKQQTESAKVISAKIPKNTLASSLPENMLG